MLERESETDMIYGMLDRAGSFSPSLLLSVGAHNYHTE